MSIIDATYFEKGYLFIPHNKDINPSTTETSENTDLTFFIDKYERELLVNALGVELYDQLAPLTTYTGKWADLVDGETYTVDGKKYKWEGLKGHNKNSLIANYTYCEWLRNDESTYTTTGIVQNKAKNAMPFSPSPKYIKAWNEFISMYQNDVQDTLPRLIYNRNGNAGLDYFGSNESAFRSLCQYITDKNEEDPTAFPDAPLMRYKSQNSFGI